MTQCRSLFLVLCFSMLVACGGGEDNSEPPAPLVEFEPTKALLEQWSVRTHDAVEQRFLFIEPLVLENKIVTASRNGVISVVNSGNGERIKEIELKKILSSGVGGDESLWVVVSNNGEMIAIDAAMGQIRWQANLPSEVLSRPVVTSDSIFARTVDGQIVGIDRLDGKIRWSYLQSKPALTLRGSGSLVVTRDRIYTGMDNGRLTALSIKDGSVIWDIVLSTPQGHSEIQRLVDVDGNVELYGYVLYAAGYQGRVAAIDVQKGRILWARDFSSYTGVTVDSKALFSSDERSHVWSLDRYSGATLWKQEKLQARGVTRPVLFGDYLVLGDAGGYLHVLSKSDGHFIARVSVSDGDDFHSAKGVLVPPVIRGDYLFVTTQGGELFSFTLGDLVKKN